MTRTPIAPAFASWPAPLRGQALRCLFVAVLATVGCSESPVGAVTYAGDDQEVSFMQADFTRYYQVHVPERTGVGPAAPLVLAFHGTGQTAESFRAQSGLDAVSDAEGFIVVYPQAAMGSWDVFGQVGFGLDEVGFVREVIDRVDQTYGIDRARILVTGLSNGGVFSQQLGCKLADQLAGFVAVAATMPKLMAEECAPSRPISALYIIGTADGFFPAAGSSTVLSIDHTIAFWANANGCAGTRIRSALPDVADDETRVYRGRYFSCKEAVRTELDSIVGGGHAWPGGVVPAPVSFGPTSRDISANSEIVRFLRSVRLR